MTQNTQATLKKLLTLVILIALFYVLWRQAFKALNLSIQDTAPFNYRGGSTVKADWYAWITPLAKVIGGRYGIPWQAICVQTAVETGWGHDQLFRTYNNVGGIKSTKGQSSFSSPTREYVNGHWITITDGFATWKTPYEGLIGYAQFFHNNQRYATALQFPHDPYRFIAEIAKAGYATAPNYSATLQGMIQNDFNA
jgi:flagellum-specific peptidoglycan hydrolase FlgJ